MFILIFSIYIIFLDTYEKGMKKLKKAENETDINSESEDNEALKKSRQNRAKTVKQRRKF